MYDVASVGGLLSKAKHMSLCYIHNILLTCTFTMRKLIKTELLHYSSKNINILVHNVTFAWKSCVGFCA